MSLQNSERDLESLFLKFDKHARFHHCSQDWAWRHTPSGFRLNYSDFAVVVDVGLQKSPDGSWSQPSLRNLIRDLKSMPDTNRDRFRKLRRGLDHAAAWIRYATEDCGSPNCDAFAVFKDLVNARAMNFSRTPFDAEGNSAPVNMPRQLPPLCGSKCEWSAVNLDYGCNKNNDGIVEQWRSYNFFSLDQCKNSCEADYKCAGIDFQKKTPSFCFGKDFWEA